MRGAKRIAGWLGLLVLGACASPRQPPREGPALSSAGQGAESLPQWLYGKIDLLDRSCAGSPGWCQLNAPIGTLLTAVAGSSESDLWVVGDAGLVVHGDGRSWRVIPSGTTAPLRGVTAWSPSAAMIVGDGGTILRWNGQAWASVMGAASDLRSVAGSSSQDVWIAGLLSYHWDGSQLVRAPDIDGATSIWAFPGGDAFAATGSGGCLRLHGGLWAADSCLNWGHPSIFATSPDDIWISSFHVAPSDRETSLTHWDGSGWSTLRQDTWCDTGTCGQLPELFRSAVAFSPTNVWINGRLHYDGVSWSEIPGQLQVSQWASGNRAVGLSRANGELVPFASPIVSDIQAFDGTRWIASATTHPVDWIFARDDGHRQWLVSRGGDIIENDGAGFQSMSTVSTALRLRGGAESALWTGAGYDSVFGAAPDDVWAYDDASSRLVHWDGRSWSSATRDIAPDCGWAFSGSDAFMVGVDPASGSRGLWHWNGTDWLSEPYPFGADIPAAAFAAGKGDVWVAGSNYDQSPSRSVAWHWDGATWSRRFFGSGAAFIQILETIEGDVWTIDRQTDASTHLGLWHSGNWSDAGMPALSFVAGASSGSMDGFSLAPHAVDGDAELSLRSTVAHFDGQAWTTQPLIGGAESMTRRLLVTREGGIYTR